MTTTIKITQETINSIAQKLDDFAEVLNEQERTVFLALMQLGGKELRENLQKIKPKPADGGTSSSSGLPPLSAGFRSAFQPGVGAKLTYDETSESELKVTIIIEK